MIRGMIRDTIREGAMHRSARWANWENRQPLRDSSCNRHNHIHLHHQLSVTFLEASHREYSLVSQGTRSDCRLYCSASACQGSMLAYTNPSVRDSPGLREEASSTSMAVSHYSEYLLTNIQSLRCHHSSSSSLGKDQIFELSYVVLSKALLRK
jgi:hypothetical protein